MPYFDGCRGRIPTTPGCPTATPHVVVLLHGYAEHLGLYDALARRLVADGHAVHAMDGIGHGRSDGERGRMESWNYYVKDARRLAGIVAARHPGARWSSRATPAGLAAYLLTLRHPAMLRRWSCPAGRCARWTGCSRSSSAGEGESEELDPTAMLSTHPEYVQALMHDPLTYKGGFRRSRCGGHRIWPESGPGSRRVGPTPPC